MSAIPDQSEVLAENAQLDLQARNLRSKLAAKGKTISAPTIGKDLLAANAALKSHVAELQAALNGKPAVAGKPAVMTPPSGSLTERVLAAKATSAVAAGDDPLD